MRKFELLTALSVIAIILVAVVTIVTLETRMDHLFERVNLLEQHTMTNLRLIDGNFMLVSNLTVISERNFQSFELFKAQYQQGQAKIAEALSQ